MTKDAITEMNSPPQINYSNGNDDRSFSDSLKVGENFNEVYDIQIALYDENNNISEFRYEILEGAGEIFSNNKRVNLNGIAISNNELRVSYKPKVLGTHLMKLSVVDAFNESSSVTFDLKAFKNVNPKSVLYYNKLGINSPYEYELIGKESFDGDSRYGGKIVLYEYILQNKRIETKDNVIVHVFPGEDEESSNLYEVGLRVKDNDGIWSEQTKVIIDITK
ncbi:MAG: hypothetical protein ABJH98_17695 [Reichenbachiella sp.]|uniref:hypothetical protein n=1 Tax=Reichenbachiella sp. TaxID=2184521 RepID=UPI00329910A7